MISNLLSKVFDLIFLVLLITILLTWIPSIKWHSEPFKSMRAFSELFLAPFRRIIPPIGMVDISPIVAFFLLGILANLIIRVFVAIGL